MASAAMATSHAKRCSGDLKKVKHNLRHSGRQLDNYGLISPQTAALALPPVRSQSIAEEEVLPYVLALGNSCAAHWDRTVWGWNWSLNGCHPQPRAYPIFQQLG